MKRFWICVTILAVLFLAALGNGRYLDKLDGSNDPNAAVRPGQRGGGKLGRDRS